ncbi:MAG: hypothetical protein PHQ80_04425 [Candidatus ainarchaeum sp.]|nr:hypothetical protein [Candidatus ainarchaeum sp.]
MGNKVSPRDIGGLIELRKKVAELKYRRGYALRKGEQDAAKETSDEISGLESKMASLVKKTEGIDAYVPFQARIEELGAEIGKRKEDEVDAALRAKGGDLYKLLEERGKLLRANVEARNEIGKIVLIGMTVAPETRATLAEAVKVGKAPEMEAAAFGPNAGKLVAALNRAGLSCKVADGKIMPSGEKWGEEKVALNNGHVWIPKQSLDRFVENETEIEKVGVRLQIKNAEKQVKNFSEEETKEFQDLQSRYLGHMKVRKEITAAYEQEIADLELH